MTGFNSPTLMGRRMDFPPGSLEREVLALWRSGRDTLDIARVVCVPESQIANMLPKILERHHQDRRWNSFELGRELSGKQEGVGLVASNRDDWEKPRGPGTKLTAAEIARLRVAFNTGTHASEIARELKCSSRNANKYYAMFRGYTPVVRQVKPKVVVRPAPEPKLERKSRFYTSNFELEG